MSKNNKQTSVSSELGLKNLKEFRAFLNSIDDKRDQLIIRILYETGCSISELTDIKVKDILGNKIMIKNQETEDIRFSQLSGKLAKDIMLFIRGNSMKKEDYLISTRQSKKISEKRITQIIHRYTEGSGLGKMNPRMLRYYHIAHAYMNGVFIENISVQLGITKQRIFQILTDFDVRPSGNPYNVFLKKIW